MVACTLGAAYQTAALHSALAPAIPHLVKLTRTSEVKPRNNSVGALGNMLRLTSVLCQQLIGHGALQVRPPLRLISHRGVGAGAAAHS